MLPQNSAEALFGRIIMPAGVLFWVLFAVGVVFWVIPEPTGAVRYWGVGRAILIFVLLGLLGYHEFGPILR